MKRHDLQKLPGIKLNGDEPVFNEPWEASAFALVIALYEAGIFEWHEWAKVLSKVIYCDDGSTPYYQLWLEALETIISQKQLLKHEEIVDRQKDWNSALIATPHGKPILLENAIQIGNQESKY